MLFLLRVAYGSLIGLRAVPSASDGDGELGSMVLIADGRRMTPWSEVWGLLIMVFGAGRRRLVTWLPSVLVILLDREWLLLMVSW